MLILLPELYNFIKLSLMIVISSEDSFKYIKSSASTKTIKFADAKLTVHNNDPNFHTSIAKKTPNRSHKRFPFAANLCHY